MNKHLKIAIFLLLLILPFFYFGVSQHNKRVHNLSRGNYFFNKTREAVDLNKISLSFNDKNSITFIKTNDLWRIKEGDDYYASFSKISLLIDLLRNTVIYRADAINNQTKTFENFIKIQTFDSNNNSIDYAIISEQNDKNKYHYAMLNNDTFLYQLSTTINLSSQLNDWLQMPILSLQNIDIKQVDFDDISIYRKFKTGEFMLYGTNYVKPEVYRLLNNIRNINAEEIKHASNFKRDNYTKVKHFVLTTFDGIIYKIDLYKNEKEFWINVSLDKKQLISPETYKRVNDNLILYNGWFFKINYDKGVILSNITI